MDDDYREALVIVRDADYESVINELRAHATVTQLLPPGLALVALPAGPGAATPDVPGAVWYEDDVPADVYNRLSAQERLFVDAWRLRRFAKERPGDHLPWDAPGYQPPDSPPSKQGSG
jgi:hypothetical protein